jgi:ferredoxin-NADP reductase
MQVTTDRLTVTDRTVVADGVVSLTLTRPDGSRLPDWEPGAHVDVTLATGETRQYSLCGDRWDPHRYRIAVLREPDGRGGSAYVHDTLRVGDQVILGGPRNDFPMVPAARSLFVAGGIGITPLLPMVVQAALVGADWELLYGGRRRTSMAFLDELAPHGSRVRTVPQDEAGLLPLAEVLGRARTDTVVYCCGPAPAADRAVHRRRAAAARARRALRAGAGPHRDPRHRAPAALRPRRRPPRRSDHPVVLREGHLRHLRDHGARRRARPPGLDPRRPRARRGRRDVPVRVPRGLRPARARPLTSANPAEGPP